MISYGQSRANLSKSKHTLYQDKTIKNRHDRIFWTCCAFFGYRDQAKWLYILCRDGIIFYAIYWLVGLPMFNFVYVERFHRITCNAYDECFLVILIYVVLASLPSIVNAIFKHESKTTSLTITNSGVYCSYNIFLLKKSLKMPIEKVDNLTIVSGLWDKLRSGVTLCISSASGIVKLHFVQNADEVIAKVIGRIEEIREEENRASIVAQPVTPASASSDFDKLKNLALMKEQGFITEDEFNKKRADIISKM